MRKRKVVPVDTSKESTDFKPQIVKKVNDIESILRTPADPFFEEMLKYSLEQRINIEKTRIILGDEAVKQLLEEDTNAIHSFHVAEPCKSMSLEELKKIFNS